jgi:hypothetical protein
MIDVDDATNMTNVTMVDVDAALPFCFPSASTASTREFLLIGGGSSEHAFKHDENLLPCVDSINDYSGIVLSWHLSNLQPASSGDSYFKKPLRPRQRRSVQSSFFPNLSIISTINSSDRAPSSTMEICTDGSCFLFGMDLSPYYLMAQLKIRSHETGTSSSRFLWLPIVWQ